MTVRELRELLFQVENQEQEVRILIGSNDWGIEKIEKSWSVFTGDFIIIEPKNKDLIKVK